MPNSLEPLNIDVAKLVASLAAHRPIFHSEADFQHALAWSLHEHHPELSIRLEYPAAVDGGRMYIDVWARDQTGSILALELKYKTRRLETTVAGEPYALREQSAQDCNRYDVVKDVCRLERVVALHPNVQAHVVFLTNNSGYWSSAPSPSAADAKFRLHEGRVLCGECAWGPTAGAGTVKAREKPLTLSGSYTLAWQDYSTAARAPAGRFRYLSVRIASGSERP